jgi:diguanylate cyclase (GGDEF)-like protein/PAS domain S-box-containing protein
MTSKDATQKHLLEQALLRAVMESSTDLVFFKNPLGIHLGCNRTFAASLGYTEDEVVGRHDRDLFDGDTADRLGQQDRQVLASGKLGRYEHRVTRPEGQSTLYDTLKIPLFDPDAKPIGIVGISRDVTERKTMVDGLRTSEAKLRAIIDYAAIGIILSDHNRVMIEANPAISNMLGYRREEMIGQSSLSLFHPDDLDFANTRITQLFSGEIDRYDTDRRYVAKDGHTVWAHVVVTCLRDQSGAPEFTLGLVEDITERKRMETELRNSEELFRSLYMDAPLPYLFLSIPDATILNVNTTWLELLGYERYEVVGHWIGEFVSENSRTILANEFPHFVNRDKVSGPTFEFSRKDGSVRLVTIDGRISCNAAGEPQHTHCIITDITERKAAEQKIKFLAFHDSLTGLSNRLLAKDRLEQAMAHGERLHHKTALLFLDLDHFKRVNDSLGHPIGDSLLKAVALRLRDCVRETDTISRQGGDEFLIILSSISDTEAVARVATKILERMNASFSIDGYELATSISIGIAVGPDDGADFDTLLKRADTAMYHAKEAGRNAYRFYTEQMNHEASEYLHIHNSLQRALDQGEFVLYYQPQISIATGKVIGAEALIRWNHPDLGLVPPSRFIPVAEDSGLIVPIGEWVLIEACRQAAEWHKQGLPDLVMAVNLSAVQFKRGDLVSNVQAALTSSGLDPSCLELELTESILIKDTANVLLTVQHLKALGIKLSIDDFGTGYSSLAYLKRFEVDKLKIDQSFIRDITTTPNDNVIVHAIVQMARSMGLKTLAEGVEDAGALESLRCHDCDEVQGFHFARPMPPDLFLDYVSGCHRTPAHDQKELAIACH